MTTHPKTLSELLKGIATMRKVVSYVQALQRRTNQRWLEFSSPDCEMQVEDYMNYALAHYGQLLIDSFATPDPSGALHDATRSFSALARDYAACVSCECLEWLRYGYKSQREAGDKLNYLLIYVPQFAQMTYGRSQTLRWIDGSQLDPEVARRMRPN